MGWLEKFFCLSVDEEEQRKAFCEGDFKQTGPGNTIRKEPCEEPELDRVAKGMEKLGEAVGKSCDDFSDVCKAVDSARHSVVSGTENKCMGDLEMLKKSPANHLADSVERLFEVNRKSFRGAKETVEGMRKREPSTWVEAVHQRHKAAKDSLKKEWDMGEDKVLDLEKDSPEPPPETRVPTRLPDRYQRAYVNDLLMMKYPAPDHLWRAFKWSDTPQGEDYWSDLHDELTANRYMKLPSQASEYLRALQRLDDECRLEEEREARRTVNQLRAEAAELKAEGEKLKAEALAMKQAIEESKHDGQYHFIGGGQTGTTVSPEKVTVPKTICLADHLKIHGQKYFIDLLADVNYVYGDAVLKLCGNNLRLDVDEVTTNLRMAMVRLREQLINEVESWFCGNGRLLETGPEIVDCCLSCRNGVWWLEEREAKSGKLGVAEEICSRLAHHLILASDVCNLLEEQKVMCLMNLILRR